MTLRLNIAADVGVSQKHFVVAKNIAIDDVMVTFRHNLQTFCCDITIHLSVVHVNEVL